jgi:uncharacterized membrane protein HdeD (DUF308 family)
MFETFKRIWGNLSLIAIACAVLGVAMLLYPTLFLQLACYVVGAVLIAYGVLGILGRLHEKTIHIPLLFVSIVSIAAGIFVITHPKAISSILPTIFGLILLCDGLVNIRHGIGLRKFGDSSGTWVLVLGIITVILGAYLLFQPYQVAAFSLRMIGAALLYNAISDALILMRMHKANKKYQQTIIDVQARPVKDEEDL